MSLAKRLRGMFRSKPISLVASVNPVFQNGVVSVSQTIPSSVQDGDFLIACVMTRSLLVEIPSGWLQAQVTMSAGDVSTQYLYLLVRTAVSGDASSLFSATQSESGRMAASITAFRSVGMIRIAKIAYQSNQYQNPVSYVKMANIEASEGIVFAASSWYFAATSGTNDANPSSGWIALMQTTSTDVVNQIRMGIAYQQVGVFQEFTGTFNIRINNNTAPHTSACSLNLVAY